MIKFEDNDIFLVTGASSGIGKAIALQLNKLGAYVIITSRRENLLHKTKLSADYPDKIYIEPKDLSRDIDSLDLWVKGLSKKYGKLSGMALSAGIGGVRPLSLVSYTESLNMMNVNYFSPLMLIKGFSDRRSNIGSRCSIVVISSVAKFLGNKGHTEYAASKAAVSTIVKNLSNELLNKNIRINSISPGYIKTEYEDNEQDKVRVLTNANGEEVVGGETSDIADLVCFLLSEKSSWINGEDIIVDGGTNLPGILPKF